MASRVPLLAPVAAVPSGVRRLERVPWGCGRRLSSLFRETGEAFRASGQSRTIGRRERRGEASRVKLCVSLTEGTTAALVARMAELADVADLFEVRADLVRDLDLAAVLRARVKPLLFTCMPESEGGRFPDRDQAGRRRLLSEAVEPRVRPRGRERPRRLRGRRGVEGGTGAGALVARPRGHARRSRGRLRADGGAPPGHREDRGDRALDRRSRPAAGVRLAPRRGCARRGSIALAMGPLGAASRILGGRYGAPFTFASAAAGQEAAPGQIPARTLALGYRVREIGRDTRVFGLVGKDILRSLSPAIQNRAFAESGIDAVYVPLQAESLAALVDALPSLSVSGFSVTRPYKGEILNHLDSVDAARRGGGIRQHGRGAGRAARRLEHGRRRRPDAAAAPHRPRGPRGDDPGRRRRGARGRLCARPRRRAREPRRSPAGAGAGGRGRDRLHRRPARGPRAPAVRRARERDARRLRRLPRRVASSRGSAAAGQRRLRHGLRATGHPAPGRGSRGGLRHDRRRRDARRAGGRAVRGVDGCAGAGRGDDRGGDARDRRGARRGARGAAS